jgi:hypothetical protein
MKAWRDQVRPSSGDPLTATGETFLSLAAMTWWLLTRLDAELVIARKTPSPDVVQTRAQLVRQLHRELAWVHGSVRPA